MDNKTIITKGYELAHKRLLEEAQKVIKYYEANPKDFEGVTAEDISYQLVESIY